MLTALIPDEAVIPDLELSPGTLELRDELVVRLRSQDVPPSEMTAFVHRVLTVFCQDGSLLGLRSTHRPHIHLAGRADVPRVGCGLAAARADTGGYRGGTALFGPNLVVDGVDGVGKGEIDRANPFYPGARTGQATC